jgi:hypothetical protein
LIAKPFHHKGRAPKETTPPNTTPPNR